MKRLIGFFFELLSREGKLPDWIWYNYGHFTSHVEWHFELFGKEFILKYKHYEETE